MNVRTSAANSTADAHTALDMVTVLTLEALVSQPSEGSELASDLSVFPNCPGLPSGPPRRERPLCQPLAGHELWCPSWCPPHCWKGHLCTAPDHASAPQACKRPLTTPGPKQGSLIISCCGGCYVN